MNSDENRAGRPDPGSLDRGTFRDQYRTYTVRASSADEPDSFQVLTGAHGEDMVLVVSGLNSGDLRATWGRFWSGLRPHAKVWVEEQAFRVFYRHRIAAAGPEAVRFCDG